MMHRGSTNTYSALASFYPLLQLLLLVVANHARLVRSGSHVYTDSFPNNDEYDVMMLDPDNVFGSPYGGFSRAVASRLASLPLKLPNIADEVSDFEPVYTEIRDSQGRLFVCRVYHEDELDPSTLSDSMFDTAKLRSKAPAMMKREDENPSSKYGFTSIGAASAPEQVPDENGDSVPSAVASAAAFAEAAVRRNQVQQALGELQGELEKLQNSIDQLKKERLNVPGGPSTVSIDGSEGSLDDPEVLQAVAEVNRRLQQMNGMCAQVHQGWWSYEWCHHDVVTQFHVQMSLTAMMLSEIEIQDITKLGSFSERKTQIINYRDKDGNTLPDNKIKSNAYAEGEREIARVFDMYTNGDICPETEKPRQTQVVLRCCSQRLMNKHKGGVLLNGKPFVTDLMALHSISEDPDTVCAYNVTVCTPLLCESYGKDEKDGRDAKDEGAHSRKAKVNRLDSSNTMGEPASVRDILDMTFGATCLQSNSGGW